MSTRCSIIYTDTFHLYFDLSDDKFYLDTRDHHFEGRCRGWHEVQLSKQEVDDILKQAKEYQNEYGSNIEED